MSTSRPKSRAQAKAAQASKEKKGGNGKIWGKRLGIAALAAGLLGAIGFFVAYATTDIPQPNDLADAQASIIYYADGKTEMDRISEVNRESVPLSKVPKAVQQAHLAAEDRNFYDNSGISPSGIARAVWVGLRGGQTQGGSTITQQYVKNYFLTQDQTLSRKAKEILISIKIAKQTVQGPDPRGLPQHHLLRPGRLRHPDGVQGLLRQGRLQAHRLRGGAARLGHPRARPTTTPAWAPSRRRTPRAGSPTSSTAWRSRAG